MPLPDVLTLLANLATFLGIPIAIFLFINEKARDRREREESTYAALDDKYIDFQRMCMEHPELDLYDTGLETAPLLSPEQKIQQKAMFGILVSLLERAFVMYEDQSTKIKTTQWTGWKEYMQDYARRPVFQELWSECGAEYEKRFVKYMDKLIQEAQSAAAKVCTSSDE